MLARERIAQMAQKWDANNNSTDTEVSVSSQKSQELQTQNGDREGTSISAITHSSQNLQLLMEPSPSQHTEDEDCDDEVEVTRMEDYISLTASDSEFDETQESRTVSIVHDSSPPRPGSSTHSSPSRPGSSTHLSSQRPGSSTRKRSRSPKARTSQEKKRNISPAEEQVVGVASDSICNVLAMHNKLNAAAYRQNWYMASRPGGTSNNLMSLIRRLDPEQPTHIIISCLSNEMANIQTISAKENSILHTIETNLIEALDFLQKNNITPIIMLPHPRTTDLQTSTQVEPHIKAKIDRLVKDIVQDYPGASTIDISEGIEPTTFIRNYLADGVHFKRTHAPQIFEAVARALGVAPLQPTDDIQPADYRPHVCTACGDKHANWGRAMCDRHRSCDICKNTSHNTVMCKFTALMCIRCGDRGHRHDKQGPKHCY